MFIISIHFLFKANLAISLNKIFINHKMPKRSRSDGNNPNKHLIKLLLNNKSNIHKKLKERETENNKIIHNGINTFYRFRLLDNNHLGYHLEKYFNDNNVKIYIINYENKDNIEINYYKKPFNMITPDGQMEKTIYPMQSNEEEEEDIVNYQILKNKEIIGDNIDFINNGYLNKSGTCFYLINNPDFFKYINKISSITVSNNNKDIGLNKIRI